MNCVAIKTMENKRETTLENNIIPTKDYSFECKAAFSISQSELKANRTTQNIDMPVLYQARPVGSKTMMGFNLITATFPLRYSSH